MMEKKKRYMKPFIICTIMLVMLVLGSGMLVVADQPPVADADPDHQTVKAGEEARFSGSGSYDPDGYIVSYYWVFGDGLCYPGENISYTFNAPGNFTVILTVIDDCGNEDTDSVTVNVVDEAPPTNNITVWIESLTTDKGEYEVNETVYTQVIVQRGNDILTYVWEGTLVLEVFDDTMILAFTDDRQVYLPSGGTTETHDFEYTLFQLGDYLVRATLFDFNGELMDTKEICITVGDDNSGGNGTKPPNNGIRMVWIESLTTDKQEYNVDEVVDTTVVVKRGDDILTYVWEGTLVLEVFDDAMIIVFSDDRPVYLPSGGMTETHNFQYSLTELGDYLVRATLFDFEDNQVDIMEICITVGDDNSGGNGTKPPNNGIRRVWIESLNTDKQEYNPDEIIETTVVVKRGLDMLTYVWEGTLVLEVFDCAMVIVFSDDRQVYLPSGGMTETHIFEYTLTEPGDYLVRATLFDFEDNQVDIKEVFITVCDDPSGGNGTVPPGGDGTVPHDDNGMGLSTADKTGVFQEGSSWLIALMAVGAITIMALSALVTIRYFKDSQNKKKKS
ncbi:MAG: PKD domain-containing protein [Thermoplasmata archaeon]|nr:MAG: PKD domain-containing protein [Thermoplasmata archaeon]